MAADTLRFLRTPLRCTVRRMRVGTDRLWTNQHDWHMFRADSARRVTQPAGLAPVAPPTPAAAMQQARAGTRLSLSTPRSRALASLNAFSPALSSHEGEVAAAVVRSCMVRVVLKAQGASQHIGESVTEWPGHRPARLRHGQAVVYKVTLARKLADSSARALVLAAPLPPRSWSIEVETSGTAVSGSSNAACAACAASGPQCYVESAFLSKPMRVSASTCYQNLCNDS